MSFEPTDFYRTHLAELHQQLLASTIVRTYLTGTGIRFDGVDLTPADRFELPFGIFSTMEFAHLFSIFDGSRVHQQAEKSPNLDEAPPAGSLLHYHQPSVDRESAQKPTGRVQAGRCQHRPVH